MAQSKTTSQQTNKRYIQASKILSDADRHAIYEGNVRRVFPRLDAQLTVKGK